MLLVIKSLQVFKGIFSDCIFKLIECCLWPRVKAAPRLVFAF